jgi:hypothetical protein
MQKFIDTEYQVSDTIRNLELSGIHGIKILIEGVKTGTTNVQAKLLDPYYKSTSTDMVRLLVVANILLEPSYPVYLLTGTFIKYHVVLIKQTSSDEIPLPSLQYHFETKNSSCANLKPIDSSILYAGLTPCSTDVILIDRNMKQCAEQYIPPTSEVTVVEASYLKFNLRNHQFTSTWVLEIFKIEVYAYTADHRQIYPSDNVLFDTYFDLMYFSVSKSSKNGSYFNLDAKKPGLTHGKTSLDGVRDGQGYLIKFKHTIFGKQDIELLQPIKIEPEILIFAWKFSVNQQQQQPLTYEYQLQATAGSCLYQWQSKNTLIVAVSNTGHLKLNSRLLTNQQQQQQQPNIDAFVYVYDKKKMQISMRLVVFYY